MRQTTLNQVEKLMYITQCDSHSTSKWLRIKNIPSCVGGMSEGFVACELNWDISIVARNDWKCSQECRKTSTNLPVFSIPLREALHVSPFRFRPNDCQCEVKL